MIIIKLHTFLTCLILYCCIFAAKGVCAELDLTFEHVFSADKAHFHPMGPIQSITQDNQGFMWFAGREGIYRYDGIKIKPYSGSGTACASIITGLTTDHSGVTWASAHSGLCRYNINNDNFERFDLSHIKLNGYPLLRTTAVSVTPDNQLLVGVAGGIIIISKDRSQQKLYLTDTKNNGNSIHNDFQTFFVEDNKKLWIGTKRSGLAVFNLDTKRFTHFRHDPSNPKSINSDNVKAITRDANGWLWLGLRNGGISVMKSNHGQFSHFTHDTKNPSSLGNNNVYAIIKDSENKLWISSDGAGLTLYNDSSNQFSHAYANPSLPENISFNKTRAIYEDRDNNLWISTYPVGIELYNRKTTNISRYRHDPKSPTTINANGILNIAETSKGAIWIGTEKGLNRYNKANNNFINHSSKNASGWQVSTSPITKVQEDYDETLWIATWGNGLYHVNPSTKQIDHFLPAKKSPSIATETQTSTINNSIVWDVITTQEAVYITTQGGGLNIYNRKTNSFSFVKASLTAPSAALASNTTFKLLEDNTGDIWITTSQGLNKIDPKTNKITLYSDAEAPLGKTIDTILVRALYQDTLNQIWIGTEDKGVFIFNPKKQMFSVINKSNGLPSNNVTNIQQDPSGNMWLFTTNGLARYTPSTTELSNFNVSHGLVNSNFNRGGGLIDSKGYIYAGSAAGLSIFDYQKMQNTTSDFPVVITAFKLFNTNVTSDIKNFPLQTSILTTDSLTLKHSDTMFSFEFSALSYPLSHWNQYAYKLEGFDSEWNHIGTENSATYTNIPPGNYTFKVKAKNSDGIWSNQIRNISITILPSIWASWWAYTTYFLTACAIVLLIIREKSKRLQLTKEKALNAELLRLNEIKDAFLANTSHELRTPLNGIIGLAEGLKQQTNDPLESKNRLNLIISSSKRLSALVNDILDHSKISENKLELHKSFIHMPSLVDDVFSITTPLAQDKNIRLINKISPDADVLYGDENRVQQILINLVSNGIKYSNGGYVSVESYKKSGNFILEIQDSGIGIPQEQLDKIFTPFNQLDDEDQHNIGGTGLGLSVTKNLIELHNGAIHAFSQPQSGSKFVIELPGNINIATDRLNTTPKHQLTPTEEVENSDTTILIADDDPINRIILGEMLRRTGYTVIEAINGQQAVDALEVNTNIKLAVLDVKMPTMSGYDACKEIRLKYTADQLPILFLTANITNADKKTCQKLLAQGILIKPILKNQLMQKIHSLLNTTTD